MHSFINLSHISKSYRIGKNKLTILENISLQISEGEFVALVGASGSGKTTILNILGCLDCFDSGEYWVNNDQLSNRNDTFRSAFRSKTLGFVFQQFNLLPHYTALENVALALIYQGISEKECKTRARHILETVGLTHRIDHLSTELSGGERQRVAIARALVTDPKIILADEPTGNLDSQTSKSIMSLFQSIHRSGKTIVLVTHDATIAAQATRLIQMQDGKLIKDTQI